MSKTNRKRTNIDNYHKPKKIVFANCSKQATDIAIIASFKASVLVIVDTTGMNLAISTLKRQNISYDSVKLTSCISYCVAMKWQPVFFGDMLYHPKMTFVKKA